MKWPSSLLVLLLLSGCASPSPSEAAPPGDALPAAEPGRPDPSSPAGAPQTAPSAPARSAQVHLRGHVLTPSLQPIEAATVTVVGLGQARATDSYGYFDFGRLERRIYTLQATAPGHLDASLTVTPDQAAQPARLVLEPGHPVTPYSTTVHFRGILQCAFEALIISPSCDSGLVAAGAPALFAQNQSFLFQADPGWATLVVDVVFDGQAHPGLDGLRVALRGSLDPDGGGQYVQYGRWHGPASFTARVEPGGNYTDGVEPVPRDATGFQVDAYPHGHAYHQACGGDSCFLGAGAALDVSFDVYATLFYVEPAPAGWTFRETGA